MILVQKPSTLTTSHFPLHTHRRHPSAPPSVVVLPTRTPGLLTLSKPPRPPLQRQTPKPLPKSKPAPLARAPVLNPPAELTDNKKSGVIALPATPSPQPRGRGQIKHAKDSVQSQRRSPSYPAVHGKHRRKPSSSIPQPQLQQNPSQAEVAVISSINSPNFFDPFVINDSSLSSNPPSPTTPSRKSVNHKPSHSLVHSKAIPVPVTTRRQIPNISRSDPLPSHRRHPTSTFQHFPICDDANDSSIPTTPPPRTRHHDNGLQTAPISSRTPGAFPFNIAGVPPSPSPVASKRGNRKHRRTPSEGVFHMSSDEDLSSGPGRTIPNPNVQALFGLVDNFETSSKILPLAFSTPVRPIPSFKRDSTALSNGSLSESECEAAEKATGYFASSMFQNSPSPEELPDPLLF